MSSFITDNFKYLLFIIMKFVYDWKVLSSCIADKFMNSFNLITWIACLWQTSIWIRLWLSDKIINLFMVDKFSSSFMNKKVPELVSESHRLAHSSLANGLVSYCRHKCYHNNIKYKLIRCSTANMYFRHTWGYRS